MTLALSRVPRYGTNLGSISTSSVGLRPVSILLISPLVSLPLWHSLNPPLSTTFVMSIVRKKVLLSLFLQLYDGPKPFTSAVSLPPLFAPLPPLRGRINDLLNPNVSLLFRTLVLIVLYNRLNVVHGILPLSTSSLPRRRLNLLCFTLKITFAKLLGISPFSATSTLGPTHKSRVDENILLVRNPLLRAKV